MPPQNQRYGEAQNHPYQGQKCVAPAVTKTIVHCGYGKRKQKSSDRTGHGDSTDSRGRHACETVHRVQVDNLQAVHDAKGEDENADVGQNPVKLGICCPLVDITVSNCRLAN